MAKEDWSNYKELGYKIRVEVEYVPLLKLTQIQEYLYNPNEPDEEKREVDHWHIWMYSGRPDQEKTEKEYKRIKQSLYNEDIDDVEFVEYISPEERKREKFRQEELKRIKAFREEYGDEEDQLTKDLEEWNHKPSKTSKKRKNDENIWKPLAHQRKLLDEMAELDAEMNKELEKYNFERNYHVDEKEADIFVPWEEEIIDD